MRSLQKFNLLIVRYVGLQSCVGKVDAWDDLAIGTYSFGMAMDGAYSKFFQRQIQCSVSFQGYLQFNDEQLSYGPGRQTAVRKLRVGAGAAQWEDQCGCGEMGNLNRWWVIGLIVMVVVDTASNDPKPSSCHLTESKSCILGEGPRVLRLKTSIRT